MNLRIIDKYKVVSFDIFDTLITRNLNNPTDLFELVEIKIHKKNEQINNFKTNRIEAEKRARMKKAKNEITLNEIYDELRNIYDENTIELLKKYEIECELDMCEINYSFYSIYLYCLKNNKRIVLVSDMYLDKWIIEKILFSNNIKFEKLFLSSELNLTKSNGSIFNYVLEELNISKNDIVHFGDNFKSDYINPRKHGIKSYRILYKENKIIKNTNEKKIEYNIIQNFINNKINKHIDKSKDYFWKLGYQIFGPLLYSFVEWLDKSISEKKINNVFFLSRDGYIMQKAFNIINKDKKTTYLYASRRALIVPTLWMKKSLNDIISSMFFNDNITVASFFKKIGLNAEKYIKVIEKHNYKLNDRINIFIEKDKKDFNEMFKELKRDIYNNSKKEYNNMLKYFVSQNFCGRVAIVDIGWYGNMQNAIQKVNDIAKINLDLSGFYIGIVPTSKIQNILRMDGFLFKKNKNEEIFLNKKYFNALFEIVFLSHHGSVKRYGDNEIEFYEYEYKNTDILEKIKKFQEGALEFVSEFSAYNKNKFVEIDEKIAILNFIEFGNNPSLFDIKMFNNFNFLDDDEYEIIPQKNFIYYFFHPQKFISDFRNSVWKTAFLKKIFKINLNYFKIILYIRKIYKRGY